MAKPAKTITQRATEGLQKVRNVNTLQMQHFVGTGNLRKIADGMEPKEIKPIATILGYADGLSVRNNPQKPDEPAIALTGLFEGTPTDQALDIVIATSAFLPSALQDQYVKLVLGNKPLPKGAPPARGKGIAIEGSARVPIVCEVGIQAMPDTAVGYVFTTSLMKAKGDVDPLADLRDMGNNMIEKQREMLALPAPAKRK
jgi:hypothetical protein